MLLSIQYLRALASVAVVFSHTLPRAFALQAGVDVFFVISGFILWSIVGKPTTPLVFWRQRLVRVVPLYWIATLVMGLHQGAGVVPIAKSLLFWPYFGEQGQIWPVMVPGWTLDYEIFFYAALGALLWLPGRARLAAIAALLVSLALLHPAIPAGHAPLLTYTSPIILEFLGGIGLAELRRLGRLPHPLWAIPLAFLALLALFVPARAAVPEGWARCLAWGLPSLLLVGGAIAWEDGGRAMRLPGLKLLGDASYAIYLAHPFVLETIGRALHSSPAFLRILVPAVLAICFGVGVHLLLERPLMLALRGSGTRARLAAVPATTGVPGPDP